MLFEGYTVTSAQSSSQTLYISGAPRYNLTGGVFVFSKETHESKQVLTGDQVCESCQVLIVNPKALMVQYVHVWLLCFNALSPCYYISQACTKCPEREMIDTSENTMMIDTREIQNRSQNFEYVLCGL